MTQLADGIEVWGFKLMELLMKFLCIQKTE